MLARIALPLLLIAALTGCAESSQSPRLVETKAVVQLLRNEAWYRLPDVMVKGDAETEDVSTGCIGDPEGRLRAWKSSTIALINNSFAPRAIGVADTLAATFANQGWTPVRTETDGEVTTVLQRTNAVAVITIDAVSKTTEHRASVRITVTGPCVITDGPESEEVRMLERVATQGRVTTEG
jgi:hypothetical protein